MANRMSVPCRIDFFRVAAAIEEDLPVAQAIDIVEHDNT